MGIPFQGDETYYIPWTAATVSRYNLQTWTPGKGPSTDILTLLPTLLLVGLRGVLGQEFAVKAYLLLMAWLSGMIPYISAKMLIRHWQLSQKALHLELASGISGLVYLLFFNNQATVAGSNNFVWNYAFFPILISSLIIFLDTGKTPQLIVFGVSSILASPQPFWPFLVGIAGLAYLLVSLSRNPRHYNPLKLTGNLLLTIGVALTFNAFWIVPILEGYLLGAGASFQLYTAQRLISPEDLSFLSFWNPIDILMMGESAHYFFWNHPQNYSLLSVTIPLLATALVIAKRRCRPVLFLGATLLLGAFITAGVNEPLGFLYFLVAKNLPYGAGAILRNPTKFVPIVTFSYALLLGLAVVEASSYAASIRRAITLIIKRKIFRDGRVLRLNSRIASAKLLIRVGRKLADRIPKTSFVRFTVVVGLVVLVLGPVTFGTWLDLQHYTWPRYHPATIPQEYVGLNSWLAGQQGSYKVMWAPSGGAYDWKPYVITAFPDLFSSRTTVAFDKIYPAPLNSTQNIGRVLTFMGVKYVIYHSDSINYPNEQFLQALLSQRDLAIVQSFNGTVIPTDSSQTPLPLLEPGTQFTNVPFQLSSSRLPRGQEENLTLQYQVPQAVVDQGFHGQFWDGFGMIIHGFPAGSVDFGNRIFYATVNRQNETSETTGSASFTGIQVPLKYPETSIDLYANFYDGSYRPLTPLYFVARLTLIPNQITNQFVVFENRDFIDPIFAQNLNVTSSPTTPGPILGNGTTISFLQANITGYEQVSGVDYRVTVKASAPFVLILAEPYDKLWRAYIGDSELEPTPVYGLANGFLVNQTGAISIRIYYTLQNYLNLGIEISVGSLSFSLIATLFLWRRNARKIVQSSKTKTVSLVTVPAEYYSTGPS
jgi:hypothetical protein